MTPLQPIAREILRLSEERAVTPVIVTPRYLSLRPIFLVELSGALAAHTDRALRIDWCRHVPSAWTLLTDHLDRLQARRINRRLRQTSKSRGSEATLQITASIARPGGAHRQLVIGWCSEDFTLPPWTVPIRLSGEPSSVRPLRAAS
jgi:hypothetical protein